MSKKMMPVAACLALALAVLSGCNGATQDAPRARDKSGDRGFLTRRLPSGKTYAVFVPHTYERSRTYPAIVFLHGMGEGGSDIDKPLSVGLAPFVAKKASTFEFICIFPQSDTGGWDADSSDAADAIAALEDTCRAYNVDRDRVALTGLSTGGYGTWAIGAKYSDHFSALVPMCAASPYTSNSDRLAKMNIWAFENAGDPFVFPMSTQASVGAVRGAGGKVKHTVYPLPGHDCWDVAYGDGEVFNWMKSQRRNGSVAGVKTATAVAVSPESSSDKAAKSTVSVTPRKNALIPEGSRDTAAPTPTPAASPPALPVTPIKSSAPPTIY